MAQRFKASSLFLTALLCLVSQGGSVGTGDMLDRASQLSDKLHALSTALTNQLDTHFPPMGRIMMPRPSACHTATLQTPHDKEQALRVSEAELLSIARALLLSWNDPLLLLANEAPTLSHPHNSAIYSKTRELQDQSSNLSSGLDRLVHKFGSSSTPFLPLPFQGGDLGGDKNSRLVNFYFLLSCFRRDSHKIDNFLKLLRCRAAKQERC